MMLAKIMLGSLGWHRIVAAPAERTAARYPANCQPRSLAGTVLYERFGCIL
jgi:hypothetical protein